MTTHDPCQIWQGSLILWGRLTRPLQIHRQQSLQNLSIGQIIRPAVDREHGSISNCQLSAGRFLTYKTWFLPQVAEMNTPWSMDVTGEYSL